MNSLIKDIYVTLFLRPVLFCILITFNGFIIIIAIHIVTATYKRSLEESLATKQPHITIRFKAGSHEVTDKNLYELIKSVKKSLPLEEISAVNGFVRGKLFLTLKAPGLTEISYAEGTVEVIGITPDVPLVYEFEKGYLFKLPYEEIRPTYKEFLYRFLEEENISVINNVFSNAIDPPINDDVLANITGYENSEKISATNLNITGFFNDLKDSPSLYTHITTANKILANKQNTLTGLMVNITNLNNLDKIKETLSEVFSSNQFIVTSWLDENKTQQELFDIFKHMGNIIKAVLFLLVLFSVILMLYRTIINNQNQIRIFYNIGIIMNKHVIIYSSMLLTMAVAVAIFFTHYYSPNILGFFSIEAIETEGVLTDIALLSSLFIILFAFFVNEIFNLKYKIK